MQLQTAGQRVQQVVGDAGDLRVFLHGAEVLHQARAGVHELLDPVDLHELERPALGLAAMRELVAVLPHGLGIELLEAVLRGDRTHELADRHCIARALTDPLGIALGEELVVAHGRLEQRTLRFAIESAPPSLERSAELLEHAMG